MSMTREVVAGAVVAEPRVGCGTRPLTFDLSDGVARVVIAGLFLGLAYRIGEDALATGRLTGLLLLASELLVVVLTLFRRHARAIDRGWMARFVVALATAGPFLVTPATGPAAPEAITIAVSAVGLVIVVAGKASLGRSFALLPANRGIVSTGLYRVVRHPIYLGYIVTHVAFLGAHPTAWNALVMATADVTQLVRMGLEERTLARDPGYRRYQRRVRWRLVPGLY